MARDPTHGGGSWSFTKCVWSPTEKAKGRGHWAFWDKVLNVRQGDTILHLRGVTPNAHFVGYSTASGDGFETSSRPPDPKTWSYSNKFFRADVRDFTPFYRAFNLDTVFAEREGQLRSYFEENKRLGRVKKNIFFVVQAGRLQCLNGAYLSEVDDALFRALFGEDVALETGNPPPFVTVETGTQLVTVKGRVGQAKFSGQIKELYGNACCFPGCNVSDPRFLIGAHIARWSDNEQLRGHLGNGLCLCLFHDRAFELGLFTLDEKYRVFVNPRESGSLVFSQIQPQHQRQIRLSTVRPLSDALLEHWNRVDITPLPAADAGQASGADPC